MLFPTFKNKYNLVYKKKISGVGSNFFFLEKHFSIILQIVIGTVVGNYIQYFDIDEMFLMYVTIRVQYISQLNLR